MDEDKSVMLRLIGAVALEAPGSQGQIPIDLGPLGQTAFAYLALERRRGSHRDELAEALWGEALPATWQASLRGIILRLGRVLTSRGSSGWGISTRNSGTYELALPSDVVVDVEFVVAALQAAEAALQSHKPGRATSLARDATRLSEGVFLPGASGEWVEARRTQLRDLHVRGLEVLSESASACGDYSTALDAAEAAVKLAPFRESAHVLVMVAHAGSGNRAEALQAFQRCRHILADELGVSPAPATEAEYLRLLSDDPQRDGSSKPEQATDLPARMDSFVGRTNELRGIRKSLSSNRIVTLTGPAGVGKSRLALETARSLTWEYPDGLCLVELADLGRPSELPRRILTTLGIREGQGGDGAAAISAALRDGVALLVLDNCERMIAACSELATALVRMAPNVRLLATSRQPLGVPGEVVWEVPALRTPQGRSHDRLEDLLQYEAVRLFLERAKSVAPDLEPDPAMLTEVCDRLEGLPLAIEIAAARMRTLALPDFVPRFDDRFRLLTSNRAPTARHRTLRAALDWSFDTLDADERALFAYLSVFSDGFSLEAVEAVCSHVVDDVVEVLSELVNKSLVAVKRQRRGNRYFVLETVREYALEKLRASAREADARRYHAEWMHRLARWAGNEFNGPDQACSLDALEAEHGNLTAALRWLSSVSDEREFALRLAVSVWRFWEVRGHLQEGRSWLEKVADFPELPSSLRAEALNSAAILAHHLSDTGAARKLYRCSLVLREDIGDLLGIAAARNGLAHLAVSEGAYAQAKRAFEANLACAEECGDESLVAATLMNLGVVEQLLLSSQGAAEESASGHRARTLLEQSYAWYESLGNVRGMALCLENLGALALMEGDDTVGQSQLNESLARRRALGDKVGITECLRFLAESALHRGEATSSCRYLEECISLWRQIGNKRRTAEVLTSLASVACAQGDTAQARLHLRQSLLLYCELADQQAADGVLSKMEDMADLAAPG